MKALTKKSNFAAIFSICAVMYSAYVGPGFASGTQTVAYFNDKGWIGVIIGPLLAGVLCFIFNLLLFEINRVYKPTSYREAYNTIYRPKGLQLFFGTFKEIQVIVVVLIALAAQISTTAILLDQLFGLPQIIGTVLFCAVVLLLSLWGAGLLRKVGTILGVAILLICGYVAVLCIGNAAPTAEAYLSQHISYTEYGFSAPYAWFLHADDCCILYERLRSLCPRFTGNYKDKERRFYRIIDYSLSLFFQHHDLYVHFCSRYARNLARRDSHFMGNQPFI